MDVIDRIIYPMLPLVGIAFKALLDRWQRSEHIKAVPREVLYRNQADFINAAASKIVQLRRELAEFPVTRFPEGAPIPLSSASDLGNVIDSYWVYLTPDILLEAQGVWSAVSQIRNRDDWHRCAKLIEQFADLLRNAAGTEKLSRELFAQIGSKGAAS